MRPAKHLQASLNELQLLARLLHDCNQVQVQAWSILLKYTPCMDATVRNDNMTHPGAEATHAACGSAGMIDPCCLACAQSRMNTWCNPAHVPLRHWSMQNAQAACEDTCAMLDRILLLHENSAVVKESTLKAGETML